MCDLSLFRSDPGLLPKHIEELLKKIVEKDGISDYSTAVAPGSCKGDNYLGDVIKVWITAKNGDYDGRYIVKRSPTDKTLRESVPINLFYGREIYTYSVMLPALYDLQIQHKLTKNEMFSYAKYHASNIEENKETVIMEDLSMSSFRMYDKSKPLDQKHLSFAIKTLAKFHATSFVLRQKNPDLFDEMAKHAAQELEYGDMVGKVMEVSKSNIIETMGKPENREMISLYLQTLMYKFQHFVDPKTAAPYNVLCHGDCWTNNFMFLYDSNDDIEDLRFLDWQIIRLASPITDIAYMMYSSTDQELRSKCMEQMMDLYYDTLKYNVTKMGCNISDCYPENIFRDHVNMIMPFGLITSMMIIPGTLYDEDDTPDMD